MRVHSSLLACLLAIVDATATAQEQDELSGPVQLSWKLRQDELLGGTSSAQQVRAAALSADASVIYTLGDAKETFKPRGQLTAIDAASGNLLWSSIYLIPGSIATDGWFLAVDPQGLRVYAGGRQSDVAFTLGKPCVAAFDAATGAMAWSFKDPFTLHSGVPPVACSPDGARVYAFFHDAVGGGYPTHLRALDAATGAQIWQATPLASVGGTVLIAAAPDGGSVYLACQHLATGSGNAFQLFSFDAGSGALAWHQEHDAVPGAQATDFQFPKALVLAPDGTRVYLTGLVSYATGHTMAFDGSSGALVWGKSYANPGGGSYTPAAMAVAPDGARIYVTGTTNLQGIFLLGRTTLAYDAASGGDLWISQSPAAERLQSTSLAVDPDGSKVYASGLEWSLPLSTSESDYDTIALEAGTGVQLWRARYEGPSAAGDYARAVLVDPKSERAYACGDSVAPGTLADVLVIAYALPALTGAPERISLSQGGAQNWLLSAGPEHAGAIYLLLGTASGTAPGIAVDGLLLPLNADNLLLHTLQSPNQPPYAQTLGGLDSKGHHGAALNLPAGLDPALAGLTLDHAFIVLQGAGVALASNALPLALMP